MFKKFFSTILYATSIIFFTINKSSIVHNRNLIIITEKKSIVRIKKSTILA